MRLGITTPVVSMLPGAHADWEVEGSIDQVATIARAADRLGYHHLTCSEHVVVPTDVAKVRGGRYQDRPRLHLRLPGRGDRRGSAWPLKRAGARLPPSGCSRIGQALHGDRSTRWPA